MKKIAIYFISGSGNSYYTAKSIADNLQVYIHNIALFQDTVNLETDADMIGLVFPVVGGNAHKMVNSFIKKIKDKHNKSFFAICTCSLGPGHSLLNIDKLLKKYESKLTYGFSILQPQSGIGSKLLNKPDIIEERIHHQKEKIIAICNHIQHSKPPIIEKSGKFSEFLNSKTFIILPTIFKLLFQLITKGVDKMRFRPSTECNGCDICIKICPVNNISMVDGFPVWGKNCIGCMGCYHWCPKDAVKSVDLDMAQYHHPDVTVSEFINALKK